MKKIILVTIGSDGDVLPFIRIGKGLIAEGYTVTLITHKYFEKKARDAGLDFDAYDSMSDYKKFHNDTKSLKSIEDFTRFHRLHLLPSTLKIYKLIEQNHQPGKTVIICREPSGVATMLASEKLGIPHISAAMAPHFISNRNINYNLMDYNMMEEHFNEIRSKLGLEPIRNWKSRLESQDESIGLWEPWFATPSPEWSLEAKPVGFLIDSDSGDTLDKSVSCLLKENNNPVLITGSTSSLFVKSDFYRSSIKACYDNNYTAIVLAQGQTNLQDSLPPNIHLFDSLPHQAIMPRVKAIIHHGGIGSTAQALASGVPQLILPIGIDRPDNAARVKECGAGDYLLPPMWKADVIGNRLKQIISSSQIKDRCIEIAEKMKNSDGTIKNITKIIEDVHTNSGKSKINIPNDEHELNIGFSRKVDEINTIDSDIENLIDNTSIEKLELLERLLEGKIEKEAISKLK